MDLSMNSMINDVASAAWKTPSDLERFEANYETMRDQICHKASRIKVQIKQIFNTI